jgi:DUF2911 family protein
MTLRTKLLSGAILVVAVGVAAAIGYWWYWNGEPPANQRGTVTQQIGRTEVSIEYNRPVARGREPFGDIVAWGQIWNPGADRAAIIRFSTDVQINGQPIISGRYSIWAQPREDAWTVIFSRRNDAATATYPEGEDALRLTVTPRPGPHMETLVFYFPVVDGRAAELVLHWGRVVVPLQITVP